MLFADQATNRTGARRAPGQEGHPADHGRTPSATTERVVFTAAADYYRAAEHELRAAFPPASVERLAPDTGGLTGAGIEIADVAEACRQRPIVFVRHLMRAAAGVPLAPSATFGDRVGDACLALLGRDQQTAMSLHVWTTGEVDTPIRSDELRRRLDGRLREQGFDPARAGRDMTVAVCVTPAGALVGAYPSAVALADWPAGRVGLAKRAGQISRAELKLDELFKLYQLPITAGGDALDLGASPGGWTNVLRRRGFAVWAVDPAPLDPRLAADPAVHHVATTAGMFLPRTDRRFDLVVNDMRMTPARSCATMLAAAHRLRPDGLGIVTLKLSPHQPQRVVEESLRLLERAYEILFARQLFHNRNEATVVCRLLG